MAGSAGAPGRAGRIFGRNGCLFSGGTQRAGEGKTAQAGKRYLVRQRDSSGAEIHHGVGGRKKDAGNDSSGNPGRAVHPAERRGGARGKRRPCRRYVFPDSHPGGEKAGKHGERNAEGAGEAGEAKGGGKAGSKEAEGGEKEERRGFRTEEQDVF